jgi:hypothetical protein
MLNVVRTTPAETSGAGGTNDGVVSSPHLWIFCADGGVVVWCYDRVTLVYVTEHHAISRYINKCLASSSSYSLYLEMIGAGISFHQDKTFEE